MIVVVMGVAGSGKTTVGSMLAETLGCAFLDGDSLHPAENIAKMSRGVPLTDLDRQPWLETIHAHLAGAYASHQDLVVACSALKRRYREFLAIDVPLTWVYLQGSEELIRSRLELRQGHYMKSVMLASQFADLEEPADAIVVDVALPPVRILEQVVARLPRGATDSSAA